MAPFRLDRAPLVGPGQCDPHEQDMTATFAADVTLAHAQEALGPIDQWLPIDGDPAMTLGEMVERNTTGPLRLGFGAWRDLMLGCQFTNRRGQFISAGGRTVKNVAGLDLTKFMVGQCGLLGKVATITTRTYRRPTHALAATFGRDLRTVQQALPTSLRPQWAAISTGPLVLGYLGDQRAIEYYRGEIQRLSPVSVEFRDPARDQAQREELWKMAGRAGTFRVSAPPVKVLEFALEAELSEWSADAAFGIVIGPAGGAACERIAAAATQCGGRATFFSSAGCVVDLSEGERTLIERIQRAFGAEGVP